MPHELAPGMSATTSEGNATVMFVAHDDVGDIDEIVMKLDRPRFGYAFMLFRADDWPTLHRVH